MKLHSIDSHKRDIEKELLDAEEKSKKESEKQSRTIAEESLRESHSHFKRAFKDINTSMMKNDFKKRG